MADRSKSAIMLALADRVLLADGAMGTMIYESGIFVNRCFDELNLAEPKLIIDIHKKYLDSGADIIETNTFGASRCKLEKFGLEGKVTEINRLGVEHARSAVASREAFVVGSVGPLGRAIVADKGITPEEAHDAFAEQIAALVDAGVDALLLETFSHLGEMAIALEAAREISLDIPIIGQFTYADETNVLGGASIAETVSVLETKGADVAGVNCTVGPRVLLEVVTQLVALSKLPVSVMPNAGRPEYVDGRLFYFATPDYFAKYAKRFVNAGARIVGGCCGTTPEHIQSMAGAVRALGGSRQRVISATPVEQAEALEEIPLGQRSPFGKKLAAGQFVVSVEIDPPKGLSLEKSIKGGKLLKAAGVDVINIADGPRATARISAQAMGLILEREVGIETILHTSCRDRNLLGLQSDMLGAFTSGFRNLLAVTGDPPLMGDYPSATGVFDVDAIGLVTLLKHLNRGLDMGGRSMKGQTAFTIGVAANPAAQNMEREMERLERKAEVGGEFIMTQPIYDHDLLREFLSRVKPLKLPVLVGILPLASFRNAEFLHNEVPGMTVPGTVRERMRKAGESGLEEGIAIAQEMLLAMKDAAAGVYVMPPFSRFSVAIKVLEPLELQPVGAAV